MASLTRPHLRGVRDPNPKLARDVGGQASAGPNSHAPISTPPGASDVEGAWRTWHRLPQHTRLRREYSIRQHVQSNIQRALHQCAVSRQWVAQKQAIGSECGTRQTGRAPNGMGLSKRRLPSTTPVSSMGLENDPRGAWHVSSRRAQAGRGRGLRQRRWLRHSRVRLSGLVASRRINVPPVPPALASRSSTPMQRK